MNIENIEKLNQLVSRTDMTGNQKVEWLVNFIEDYKYPKSALNEDTI